MITELREKCPKHIGTSTGLCHRTCHLCLSLSPQHLILNSSRIRAVLCSFQNFQSLKYREPTNLLLLLNTINKRTKNKKLGIFLLLGYAAKFLTQELKGIAIKTSKQISQDFDMFTCFHFWITQFSARRRILQSSLALCNSPIAEQPVDGEHLLV